MLKSDIRQEMKEKRLGLSEEYKKKASEKIFKSLVCSCEYQKARAVCVYRAIKGEVPTDIIIEDLRRCGKEILFPVSDKKTHTLSLCRDCGEYVAGAYGILEPKIKEKVDFSYADFVIVPGLAFDRKNNRLGFGAGYYDRFLSESKSFKAGICYDFQLIDEIPTEEHDIPMDAVITEREVFLLTNIK